MARFVFQDEYYPRNERIAAAQKLPEPQPFLFHERQEMMIHSHEVKREHAKMEFESFALKDDHYHGRKWRLGARERREEIMNIQNHDVVFQRIAAVDENYGRNWRVAAHQHKREDIITNQNHQAKADQLADILFQRPAPLMDENHHGRKWRGAAPQRQAKQQAYNYYQSDQPEQQPYIYEVKKPAPGTEDQLMVMDAFEAVRLHGGVLIIDYAKRK